MVSATRSGRGGEHGLGHRRLAEQDARQAPHRVGGQQRLVSARQGAGDQIDKAPRAAGGEGQHHRQRGRCRDPEPRAQPRARACPQQPQDEQRRPGLDHGAHAQRQAGAEPVTPRLRERRDAHRQQHQQLDLPGPEVEGRRPAPQQRDQRAAADHPGGQPCAARRARQRGEHAGGDARDHPQRRPVLDRQRRGLDGQKQQSDQRGVEVPLDGVGTRPGGHRPGGGQEEAAEVGLGVVHRREIALAAQHRRGEGGSAPHADRRRRPPASRHGRYVIPRSAARPSAPEPRRTAARRG